MKTRCKKECPKYNTCSLCLGGKECSYPEYSYLKYNWFEKLINKIMCKNKENEQNYSSICTTNQNKPECSLIEELRELQNKKEELKLNTKTKPLCFIGSYSWSYYGFGVKIDIYDYDEEKAFDFLKEAIKEEEIYLKSQKEIEKIDNRIKEIKQQLGIK